MIQKPAQKKIHIPLKNALIVLFAALLIALAGLTFLSYEIYNKSVSAGVLAKELEEKVSNEQRIRELEDSLAASGENLAKLENYFISSEEIVDFIEQIESLAAHAGVEASFDTVSVQQRGGAGAELDLRFVTKANFSQTMYFLHMLEALPLLVIFDQVFIKSASAEEAEQSSWEGRFSVTLVSFTED